jgi:hypothetical protein
MAPLIETPYASLLLLFLFVYFALHPSLDYIRDKHGM